MDTLNMIGSICSILSFFLAIFITSKVVNIDNSSKVKQKGNSVHGDMAGHDITK